MFSSCWLVCCSLDYNGDGVVSWDELLHGLRAMEVRISQTLASQPQAQVQLASSLQRAGSSGKTAGSALANAHGKKKIVTATMAYREGLKSTSCCWCVHLPFNM